MSTELKSVKGTQVEDAKMRNDFELTRFSGGKDFGACLVVSQDWNKSITLTKQEALRMAAALVEFANDEREIR